MKPVKIGEKLVGSDNPVFIIAEIGINHNGSLELAKRLIDIAAAASCDAVKFQKRTPEACVPRDQWDVERDTPWGRMTYIEYRRKVELGQKEYEEIDRHCRSKGIQWFASCWDRQSVDFIEAFNPPCYKIASACLTDDQLLWHHRKTRRPIILSTGMSTIEQIDHAVEILGKENLVLMHCTSTYPCQPQELNLRVISQLRERHGIPVGYSGHEIGLATTVASTALGVCAIERHITVDRAMYGSDQAASVEPQGLNRLVRDIRVIESAMGDGVKRVYPSEMPFMKKLRRVG